MVSEGAKGGAGEIPEEDSGEAGEGAGAETDCWHY